MHGILNLLTKLVPYVIIFFFAFLTLIIFLLIIKKKTVKNNNISFYGLFMDLSTKDLLSLSIIYIFFFFALGSIFINDSSYINLIVFLSLSVVYAILNKKASILLKMILNSILVYTLIYVKTEIFNYIADVSKLWYVIAAYGLICVFILYYAIFIFLKESEAILKNNKYIKKALND